jgi:hypothetical protein
MRACANQLGFIKSPLAFGAKVLIRGRVVMIPFIQSFQCKSFVSFFVFFQYPQSYVLVYGFRNLLTF